MSQPIAFRPTRVNHHDQMIVKVLGIRTRHDVSLINSSPLGDSLDEIRPTDWIRYPEVQGLRSLILAGRNFSDALVAIDTDYEPEAGSDICGETA
jgi:hypothetical protein